MNHFSIRDIENLCNIRAHTLRIWEQRYGVFIPNRKESMHRVYSNEDLKALLRISFLYHHGYKISKIAALSPDQINELVTSAVPETDNYELFINQLITASLEFDKNSFEQIVRAQLERLGLTRCISDIFYPFLNRIGLLWLTNHVIPAQEHFSSHIIRKKIIFATDALPKESVPGAHILVFAPEGEFHEIPLLWANYFWRKSMIRTTYFGVNVKLEAIEFFMAKHACTHLYAHIISLINQPALIAFFQELEAKDPEKQILLSGPGAQCLMPHLKNAVIFQSMQELISFAEKSAAGTPAVI